MSFGHTVRVSMTIPLLLAAAACVPQDNAPKAANAASPAASAAVAPPSAAPATPAPSATQMPQGSATPKTPAPQATKIITDLAVPRSGIGTATYRCRNGGMITIQDPRLVVACESGRTAQLRSSRPRRPARAAAIRKRLRHDAIVIDGREALVMKRGSTPQACRR
ncbi:hypothetical protein ACVOMV_05415 [Mesorhizobium atlanticum]